MITVKELHMQETVKAALEYINTGYGFDELRERFTILCADWNATEYDDDPLSRRHVLAQRVVIECVSELKTDKQLKHLDETMDKMATFALPVSDMLKDKPVGALCYLPKTIHILASNAAKTLDKTAKRFFFEAMLRGLEQQGVISREQHFEALKLPADYGWKGRNK